MKKIKVNKWRGIYMNYSVAAALAFFVLFFENYDIFFNRQKYFSSKVRKTYRRLLLSVMIFYVTDIGWGIIDIYKYRTFLHIDSQAYFLSMALCVCFLVQFVVEYLDKKDSFGKFLIYSGRAFLFFMVIRFLFPNRCNICCIFLEAKLG